MEKLRTEWDLLSRDDIRKKQGAKLHWFLKQKVLPNVKYYQELFRENGLDADDIRSLDDLQKIPFSSKADLAATPDRPKDFIMIPDRDKLGKQPGVILEALLRGRPEVQGDLMDEYKPIFLTSTTGRSAEPVPFLYTKHDINMLRSAGQRLVWVLGASPEIRIVNMFPFAPHLAFWQTHYACTAADVFTVSTGGGKTMGTDGNLRLIEKLQPEILIGMPTFLYHLLHQAVAEGRNLSQVRHLVFGGEKVPKGMRMKLKGLTDQLGCGEVSMVATYGFTEAKMAWGQCPFPTGEPTSGYHLYPDLSVIEIIDPETGEVLPDNTPGEIVYTALDSRGSIVLRYRTGDITDKGLTYETCPHCGRRCPRIMGHISRQSDIKEMHFEKLKGTLVDFNQLERVLDNTESISSWQVELRKKNDDPMECDELVLHVVTQAGEKPDADFDRRLSDKFAGAVEIRPNRIEYHDTGEMRRLHGVGEVLKEQRIVDNRPKS